MAASVARLRIFRPLSGPRAPLLGHSRSDAGLSLRLIFLERVPPRHRTRARNMGPDRRSGLRCPPPPIVTFALGRRRELQRPPAPRAAPGARQPRLPPAGL